LQNVLVTGSRIGVNLGAAAGIAAVMRSCTLVDNGIGIRASAGGNAVSVRNCIVVGDGKALTYAEDVLLDEGYNIFFRPEASARLIVRTAAAGDQLYSGDDVNDGRWRADSGQGEATVALDPHLDPVSYVPRPGSVAVDSADDATSPAYDLAGLTRPAGSAADRGAYEWTPTVPAAAIRGALVRGHLDGTGDLRVELSVSLAPEGRFAAATDPVRVVVRGERGEVTRVEVSPGAWSGARSALSTEDATQRLKFRPRQSPRRRLSLDANGGAIRLRLRADDVPLWVLNAGSLSVEVEIGDTHASAAAVLQGDERRLSL
jgi:hypothetical protein